MHELLRHHGLIDRPKQKQDSDLKENCIIFSIAGYSY
uniref:Uncharacterized protein n=1 Tax=Rhizophora mucronata TaxID=61149 RepID=A0A2P2QUA1_RHIMU